MKFHKTAPFFYTMLSLKISILFSLIGIGLPKVIEEIFETDTRCNKGKGRIIQIGTTRRSFEPKIDVCFDFNTQMTYWTSHYVKKRRDTGDTDASTSWSKEFFDKIDPKTLYEKNVDRGHLTPRADFHTDIERKMTFFYINAAPQVSSLNRGSWKNMEAHVRELGRKEKHPLKIITGSGGKLYTLNTKVGYNFPEYFFKVVLFSSGRKEVYIGINDVKRTKPIKGLCGEIENCGWNSKKGGTVYCCKYSVKLMDRFGIDKKALVYGN